VLESPALAGIASKKRDKRGRPVIDWANLPGDGDLITDRTYDDLKAAAMASDSGV